MEAKLYSPVFCDLWEESDTQREIPEEISQGAARWYFDEIQDTLLKELLPDEGARGLMNYYRKADSVDEKVRSLFVDVEIHDDKVWAVATIEVTEPLTKEELDILCDYIEGQYSDGFGEGFEQRDIEVEDGVINVHLWNFDEDFLILTQEQFSERLGINLPADALSQKTLQPETPAQAALHEPDASESEEVAALRERLMERIDNNFSEYFDVLRQLSNKDISEWSLEVSAVTGAYFYMKELHNFHTSELEYLLQFKDPLKVAADEFESENAVDDRSGAMWKIFREQLAIECDYELMSDISEVPELTQKNDVTGEKPSVLEQIREATKAPTVPHKEKSSREKGDATI